MRKIYLSLLLVVGFTIAVMAQTEPENQPTNLQVGSTKAYKATISYASAGSGIKYLVLRSENAISTTPTDNVQYLLGDNLGNATVVGNSGSTLISLRGLNANTNYHIAVFAFRDGGGYNYKTDNPLMTDLVTLDLAPDDYYTVDVQSQDFLDELSNLLSSHTQLDYGQFDETVVFNIHQKNVGGIKAVNCEYSNEQQTYTGTFDWTNESYNREHMLPKSWMPSNADNNDPEGSDYHNLALLRDFVNSERLNYPLGEVSNATWTHVEASFDGGQDIFEPREDFKGDVARALFYMVTCYDGKGGSWAFDDLQTFGPDQDVNILKQWHTQDPVSNFEIAKHEYIAEIQGSRNPFVDNPQWVDCINFNNLTLVSGCQLDSANTSGEPVGVRELLSKADILVYPNPTRDLLNVKLANNESIDEIEILSSTGQVMQVVHTATFDVSTLPVGIYLLKIQTEKGIYVEKIQKQ